METMDDNSLREQLLEFGVDPGKINDRRRPILIKQLNHLRARQRLNEEQTYRDSSTASGRGKSKGSSRKKTGAGSVTHQSSSEENEYMDDDDINENRYKAGILDGKPVKETTSKLRRRTVDVGLLPREQQQQEDSRTQDDDLMKASTRSSTRRSVGSVKSDSPFLAGSLRVSQKTSSPARQAMHHSTPHKAGYLFDDDMSISDNDASFVELASMGVNTTQSLGTVEATTPSKLAGNLKSGYVSRPAGSCLSFKDIVSDTTSSKFAGYLKSSCSIVNNVWSCWWHTVSQILPWLLLVLFIVLGLLYAFAVQSDTQPMSSMDKSGDFLPCEDEKNPFDDCLENDEIPVVRELVVDIIEILSRRAGDFECRRSVSARHMSMSEMESVLQWQYGKTNTKDFRGALKVIRKNDHWGIRLLDDNRSKLQTNDIGAVTFLESVGADRSIWCRLTMSVWRLSNHILITLAAFAVVTVVGLSVWYVWKNSKAELKEVHKLVSEITGLLQNHAQSCRINPRLSPYLAIPHVRDALIPLADRKRKQKIWARAAKFLSMNESRVREEVKMINGEEYSVWCWIDTLSDNSATTVLRPLRTTDVPTKCHSAYLRVCNMLETSDKFSSSDIYDMVLERCGTHAGILHIGTTSDVPDSVYVKFVSESAAGQAYQYLHGWQFQGKLTSVKEVGASMYRMLFPESASAMVPLRSRRQSQLLHSTHSP
jgi:membrane protein Man1